VEKPSAEPDVLFRIERFDRSIAFYGRKLLLVPETFVNADERLRLRDVWAA
jgi:hypothetical protein